MANRLYSNCDDRHWKAAEDIMHMDNYHNILAVAERAKVVLWNMREGSILHQINGNFCALYNRK